MNKEEIIAKIESFTRKVKTPGRAYSKTQREEMREEISALQIELEKIKFEDDLLYIKDFVQKHPKYLLPEMADMKDEVDKLLNDITERNLMFVLEFKIKSFYNEIRRLTTYESTISELYEALSLKNYNESIPPSNPNNYKKKEDIQKSLAVNFRALNAMKIKLNTAVNEIKIIINFFINDNKLSRFVYLTNAVFFKTTNFEKGFSIVQKGGKEMYLAYNGIAYKKDSDVELIPKIQTKRLNPDLIPFEVEDGNYNILMGYKNSNGEIIIPAKFKIAERFVNGFAKVGILKEKNTKITYGLIDDTGVFVLPCDFIELGDVFNDVVIYKKHIYKDEMVQTWNFDWKEATNYTGLYSGFLIYNDMKTTINSEIEIIKEIENTLPSLKTRGEVDDANNKITMHRRRIDYYLIYITNVD